MTTTTTVRMALTRSTVGTGAVHTLIRQGTTRCVAGTRVRTSARGTPSVSPATHTTSASPTPGSVTLRTIVSMPPTRLKADVSVPLYFGFISILSE